MAHTLKSDVLRHQLEQELTGNILPFWMTHAVDRVNGGFYGAVTNDLQVHNDVPRSAVLCARILWTFAAAYRMLGTQAYLSTARWAYDYLTGVFWDPVHGGLYWQVDYQGRPVSDRKHHFAQAYGIYGLAEYYRAANEPRSLELAQILYHLLEEHGYDAAHQGYIEGSSREWGPLVDMRLSDRDLHCRKSMNTMMHIMEAYTNLLRAWDDAHLRAQLTALINVFIQHVIDHQSSHLKLFFDDEWRSLKDALSFGHDIEASWLLCEAAEVLGDPSLRAAARESAIRLAAGAYRDGLDEDGSLFFEGGPQGVVDAGKAWWVQAEAVVGFYNAFQLTGHDEYLHAAYRCWDYIQAYVIDRVHGDWFKQLHRDGTPDYTHYKVGPWECPYHQSRTCMEMLARLGSQPALDTPT